MENKKGKGTKVEEEAAAAVAEEQTPETAPEADRVKELEEALAAKEAEAKDNWDKFLRERADLENFRKRTQREKEEILKYGNESLVLEILPALDSMDRALSHANEEVQGAVIEGVRLTHGMLLSALKKFGVEPAEGGKGQLFDPALHHAMSQVETADVPPSCIVEEFQKGYTINGRLLRAAMVSVSVAPKTATE